MNVFTKSVLGRGWCQYYQLYDNVAAFTRSYSSQCSCVCLRSKYYNSNQFLKNPDFNCTSRRYIMSPIGNSIKKGFDKLSKKLLLIDDSKQIVAGYAWFRTLDDVDFTEFIIKLNMPDTFQSWFKVMQLHVWMLLVNLMKLEADGSVTRNTLVSAMWEDFEKRAKSVDSLNKNFKKNVKELSNDFKMALIVYDEGYLKNDMALANALWVQFFNKNCDDPRKLEVLVSYVRHQLHFMSTLAIDIDHNTNQIKGKVWTPFKPHLEKFKLGTD